MDNELYIIVSNGRDRMYRFEHFILSQGYDSLMFYTHKDKPSSKRLYDAVKNAYTGGYRRVIVLAQGKVCKVLQLASNIPGFYCHGFIYLHPDISPFSPCPYNVGHFNVWHSPHNYSRKLDTFLHKLHILDMFQTLQTMGSMGSRHTGSKAVNYNLEADFPIVGWDSKDVLSPMKITFFAPRIIEAIHWQKKVPENVSRFYGE